VLLPSADTVKWAVILVFFAAVFWASPFSGLTGSSWGTGIAAAGRNSATHSTMVGIRVL
jgi:hypothetical protein